MKRVVAAIAAVVMIGAALVVRSRLDEGEDARRAEAERPTGTLVCAPELQRACDELKAANPGLDVRIEEAGDTFAAITKASFTAESAGFVAWLAPEPYPTMARETRARANQPPVLGDATGTLARSPVVLVVWSDRYRALGEDCAGGAVDWTCIGAVAGTPWSDHHGEVSWGAVKPGHPRPDRSATGLLVLGQATGQFLGRTDWSRAELDDPTYRAWLDQLERAVPTFTPSAGSPLAQMLFAGVASFDLAGSIEALAAQPVTTSRDKDRLAILYPSPVATADAVLVPLAGSENGGRVKKLLESSDGARALAQSGWRVEGQPAATGVRTDPTLPATTGLPRPGALQALRDVWSEVAA